MGRPKHRQGNLFSGEFEDAIVVAKEKYGIWPFSVWECDNWEDQKRSYVVKEEIGDTLERSNRRGCGEAFGSQRHRLGAGTYGYRGGVSIFSPAVASWILNMYAPKTGVCYDPFAGGGTRAILSAKHGLAYCGVEIRPEECDDVKGRCAEVEVRAEVARGRHDYVAPDAGSVLIIADDSRRVDYLPAASMDFCITCPPYWNLEKYHGGPGDLSMAGSYEDFIDMMADVIWQEGRVMKDGAVSVWVVGLHRRPDGTLVAMNHDVARAHQALGFTFKEEIILYRKFSGAGERVSNFERGNRFLARCHEYAQVFTRKRSPEKP